jgi:TAP-like protein
VVISAREDPLAPYRFATAAVARIAGGRLVMIELGGHQFAGHDAVVGEAISAFVASAGPNSA